MSDTARIAIVTGASKGIGLAIAQRLVADGLEVLAVARGSSAELETLIAGGHARFVAADLSTEAGAVAVAEASGGRVDVLVNNVGAAHTRTGGFLSITDQDWVDSVALNFLAAVRITRAVIPLMPENAGSAIVTIASVNSVLPDPAVMDYSAAKAALLNFSKGLSAEYGEKGIRVNAIDPGPVGTDLWLGTSGVAQTVAAATGLTPEQVQAGAVATSATKRFTAPSEIAAVVAFLIDPAIPNLTGSAITIDGGLIPTI